MNFFTSLLNKIRGINIVNRPQRAYIFGVILSGNYANWKKDPHPTFLCLGTYGPYVHGIQLHAIGSDGVNFIINTIKSFKTGGIITNPLSFFYYIKSHAPKIISVGYRTYKYEYCDFKVVNAGLTNIKNCYPPDDTRDGFLNSLTEEKRDIIPNFSMESLKNSIKSVINNTVKVWN